MSKFGRLWDLAWNGYRAFKLYEFLRDHYEDWF